MQNNRRNPSRLSKQPKKIKSIAQNSSSRVNLSDLQLSCVDLNIGPIGVGTSQANFKLEDNLMGLGGFLQAYPQTMSPYMAGTLTNVRDFVGRIKYYHLEVRLNITGSQANTLLAGDLYSRVRVLCFWTKTPYREVPQLNSIHPANLLDRRDVDKLFYDEVINLPTLAFDTVSGFNSPDIRTVDLTIPLSSLPVHEVFSKANGTEWDSRVGSFYLMLVSDSSVLPHPSVDGMARLYFKILK